MASRQQESLETGEPLVQFRGVSKHFGPRANPTVRALDSFDLTFKVGEFAVLLGPSGCGKTTALRVLAGLEHADAGTVIIGGRTVTDVASRVHVPPHKRGLGMVFQTYALWPHLTVLENVAFPLGDRRQRKEGRGRAIEMLQAVRCEHLADRYPAQLSGGQQQRVALARALVARPRLVLFDEPLSNLDAQLRLDVRVELRRLHRELGFTAVYVTHDQDEAMSLASRLVVMNSGTVVQEGPAHAVYEQPVSPGVARFLGCSETLVLTRHGNWWQHDGYNVLPADRISTTASQLHLHARPADFVVRTIPAHNSAATPELVLGEAVVLDILPGELPEARLQVRGSAVVARGRPLSALTVGDHVALSIPLSSCHFYAENWRVEARKDDFDPGLVRSAGDEWSSVVG